MKTHQHPLRGGAILALILLGLITGPAAHADEPVPYGEKASRFLATLEDRTLDENVRSEIETEWARIVEEEDHVERISQIRRALRRCRGTVASTGIMKTGNLIS